VKELSGAELDELIAEATVDCYGEEVQLTGLATMIADNPAVPFETTVPGVTVTVSAIDRPTPVSSRYASAASTGRLFPSLTCRCQIRLPGAEWIAAYRRWAQ
jgi:hypothetical protein